nr:MAG TPA: hypothetical protein [Caudoviricetes sp.]
MSMQQSIGKSSCQVQILTTCIVSRYKRTHSTTRYSFNKMFQLAGTELARRYKLTKDHGNSWLFL